MATTASNDPNNTRQYAGHLKHMALLIAIREEVKARRAEKRRKAKADKAKANV